MRPLLLTVQERLNHSFSRIQYLLEALTHSSYSNENSNQQSGQGAKFSLPDNERLEFLGDAVIGLVVAHELMKRFPRASEGKLSRWRSQLVSRKTLAEIATSIGMQDWILLGKGERRTGGSEKRSILAGVFEALVGALYLDAGLEKATVFLMDTYADWFGQLDEDDRQMRRMFDMKTHLQERTQSLYKCTPVYRLIEAWGLEHEKHFRIAIEIEGKIIAEGDGRSKKEAEQHAASLALEILGF